MLEENLNGNSKHQIIRIGDTVHRPTGWWTPAVHELLKYLEAVGFKFSPRVLGFDDKGREILSYIKGDSGKDGWGKIITDEGLRNYAKLLREYHDAVANYSPNKNSVWAYKTGGLSNGEIMCHGDFGVWNIVWQGSDPVGIVDWDFVLPAPAKFDILYALEYSAPFRDDETALKWHHFPKIPDRKHRIKVFTEAYGIQDLNNLAKDVASQQRTIGKYVQYLANKGLQPQKDWVENGELEKIEKQAQWIESNKNLFE